MVGIVLQMLFFLHELLFSADFQSAIISMCMYSYVKYTCMTDSDKYNCV